eukprot:CAMPEP_0119120444 /NCGR_PEP_ID=MMETSP1310-20130426/1480_1 /TAXON_ID=464262 /ORGANISM="Genus nov. species nov., Strain RCC2339" /LENGTH=429 /DNA_ID=CAMNT_0007109921 /DNA_START=248 /DNA_END=1533 /DNA_ORIENTATION=+
MERRCLLPFERLQLLGQEAIPSEVTRSKRHCDGFALAKGRRDGMEDFVAVHGCLDGDEQMDLYCIFDGHGGDATAQFAASNISSFLTKELVEASKLNDTSIDSLVEDLQIDCGQDISTLANRRVAIAIHRTFGVMTRKLRGVKCEGGTTALLSLFLGDDLYVANVGDSSTYICKKNGSLELVSVEHRPTDKERDRIVEQGGMITDFSVPRVEGQLAISRALGNLDLEEKGIIWHPFIRVVRNFRRDYRYIVMASDGLWDKLTHGEVSKITNDILGYKVKAWRPRRQREAEERAERERAERERAERERAERERESRDEALAFDFDEEDEASFAEHREKLHQTFPYSEAPSQKTRTLLREREGAGLSFSEGNILSLSEMLSSYDSSQDVPYLWHRRGCPSADGVCAPVARQEGPVHCCKKEMDASKKLVET